MIDFSEFTSYQLAALASALISAYHDEERRTYWRHLADIGLIEQWNKEFSSRETAPISHRRLSDA